MALFRLLVFNLKPGLILSILSRIPRAGNPIRPISKGLAQGGHDLIVAYIAGNSDYGIAWPVLAVQIFYCHVASQGSDRLLSPQHITPGPDLATAAHR